MTDPVTVAGQRLEAGTYSVFTVPGPETWEIRFNSALGMDGTGRLGPDGSFTETYDPADDVLTVEVPTESLDEPVDQFTIAFDDAVGGTHLVLSWETTAVRVPITPAGM